MQDVLSGNDVKVLAIKYSGPDQIELVQHGDGSVAIAVNGQEPEGLCWRSGHIEQAAQTFIHLRDWSSGIG